MPPTRLVADIEKQLEHFRLALRLEVGTEVLVLFGPSGAGKTTVLNAIAGLVTPDAGEITLDGRPFFRRHRPGPAVNLPARKRRIGYVFQQYALFPHLTALENVAYPLRRRRDGRQQAMLLLRKMGIAHLAHRYPREMSGGQQQRVAIARALAAEPQVLLLDEPFSALDATLRERLQRELRDLQRELGLVVLYVTHSLEDAFAVGHRLAVIRQGRVEQVGPVEAVFRRPTNRQVAEIMGIRNLFHARVVAGGATGLVLDWDGLRLEAPPQPAGMGEVVTAYIRPEDIKVLYPDRPLRPILRPNQVVGRIVQRQPNSSFQTLRVALANGHQVEVRFPTYAYAPLSLRPGEEVHLSLRKDGLVILHPPSSR
ncbi:MAG: ABC transporter ATP-binding protein [Chloroflexi bacterium]|nr:MAG: ABC transporter ATP-binding protein [Chloroflexota bacterium]